MSTIQASIAARAPVPRAHCCTGAAPWPACSPPLARMAGVEDGVVDDLFRFSQPVSGACTGLNLGWLSD